MQGHRGALPADIGAILGKPPLDDQPVLFENCRQAALHQAKPIAVERDLVLRIDRRDTVLEIDDGAESGFKNDIRHAGFAFRPDQAILIDLELDVQAMVAKQHDKASRATSFCIRRTGQDAATACPGRFQASQ